MKESNSPNIKERYCSFCGISLIPLDIPHISRECEECGKEIYFVRKGDDGKGIKIEDGEKFTIPSSIFKFSLEPSPGSHLYKHGVYFVVQNYFTANLPKKVEDLPKLFEHYTKMADTILENSTMLNDFNLHDEKDSERVFELLKKKPHSREWYALLLGSYCESVKNAIEANEINEAIWAMSHASACYALTVVSESTFRQTLWRGYLANQTIYEAASAASSVPGESEAIIKLQELFNRLDEATLHTYVESGLPIGPRIGVSKLPEPIILALAKFHLTSFEKEREEKRRAEEREHENKRLAEERKQFNRKMKIKWCSIGISAATALGIILSTLDVI